jgi:hypothetical protein
MTEGTTDGQRKWHALLDGFRAVLPRVDERFSLGLLTYPRYRAPAANVTYSCDVSTEIAVPFSFGNSAAVLEQLANTRPSGGTPTAAALQRAYEIFQSVPDSIGRRYIVLATDGAPNCNGAANPNGCACTGTTDSCNPRSYSAAAYSCLDDERTLAVLRSLAARGVQTFVMGLAGTGSFADVLSAMAVAGGRPRTGARRYYSAESSEAIDAALDAITSSVAGCYLDLDEAPPDPELVDVRIGSVSLGRDPARSNGWYWAEGTGHRRIEFYGETCERVRSGSGGVPLVAAFGCPAAPAPP